MKKLLLVLLLSQADRLFCLQQILQWNRDILDTIKLDVSLQICHCKQTGPFEYQISGMPQSIKIDKANLIQGLLLSGCHHAKNKEIDVQIQRSSEDNISTILFTVRKSVSAFLVLPKSSYKPFSKRNPLKSRQNLSASL